MTVVERLGWVLLHSVWQFAVIALVAGVVAAMLRARSAAARYTVLVGAMALMAVAPVVTWCSLPSAVVPNMVAVATVPPVMPIEPEIERTPDVTAVSEPPPSAPTVTPVVMTPSAQPDLPIAAPAPVVEHRTWSETLAETLRPWMTVLVAAWSLGVVLCSLRPLLGWWTLHRLQTLGVSAVSDDLAAMFQRASDRIGLRKAVRVLQSTLCQTPMVLGYFRPVVLLPVSLLTRIPPAQLEAILAHELAHIRRHDFVINLLQTLIETLCFYHPAVWWVSHRIRIEREHCCDDLVIAAFNNRTDYGRALLAVEELRGVRPHLALGAADGSLLSRIRRIVGLRTDVAGYSVWTGFALLMGFVTAAAGVSVFANLLVNAPTKPQTTLVVESTIVVEHILLHRLREMKSTRREKTADSAEILRFSSDEFHAVFRDVKDGITPRLSGYGTCRVLPPSSPAFAPIGIAHSFAGAESWKTSPTSRTHINWSGGGLYFCASSAEEVELRLKTTYSFDVQQDTGANPALPMLRGQTQLDWKGRVPSGEIVAVVTSPQNSNESFVHLLSLYEAVAVPTENLKLFEAIQSQAPRDKWIEAGPTLALQQTERAAHWHSTSKKSIRELDEQWHRRLPGGGHVQLIAIGRPKTAPAIWWTPTGEPITGLPHNITPNLRSMEYAAVLRIWEEDQSRSSMAPNSVSMSNGITHLPDEFRIASSQLVIVPVEAPQAGGHPHLAIGAGIGAWTSEANIAAKVKAEAELNQVTFKLAAFSKLSKSTAGVFYWKPVREWDWTVTAVTKDGQRIPCSDNPLVYANDPQDTKQIGSLFHHPITEGQIDHYVIQSRPCQWIDFVDFALQPAVALVPPQDFSATDPPPPGDVPPLIASWNNQRSLEFVGITKNTAAVKEGWQPNGAPIGDVPNWKSTIVLHSGDTPGNFATSTYTEGQLRHKPDENAIDFLFRFRGLKAQPSLTFDLPANGASYSHWPVADPYEVRISARHRGPPPPGGHWSPPDGVLRVGLTDEPWGRWVKITPEGEVPEPVQPEELYASTYRLIEVRGAVPHERSPLGTAIQIHEPAGNRDPEDEWHRFSFEFRAVDTEGKDHWAFPWESQGEGDSKWVNGQYAVANSFPKDKTLSHYEYRLRPYRHWAIFENVSLEPGKATTVKVSTRTVLFDPAEKLAQHFGEVLKAQRLPFLDDAKIAVLSGELLDTLRQRPPAGVVEEQLRRWQDEFQNLPAELASSTDVLQRLRFYYAGLTLPALSNEQWRTLTDGVTQYVRREFDPREKDYVYLAFRDRFETLRLFVAAYRTSPELTPEQRNALQDQRAWMKQEILKLPESKKLRVTHGQEIDKLQKVLDDPLNPFFRWPFSASEFADLKQKYAKAIPLQEELLLFNAVTILSSAAVELRANPLRDAVPVRTYGWSRSGSRWRVLATPTTGNSSLHLHDRHELRDSSYANLATMNFVREKPPAKLEDHAAWLQQQGQGDLAYDAQLDAFVAVRGAKLAVLPATSWYAADIVPLAELKALLDREGQETVAMSTFVNPSKFGNNRVRDLRENAPSLVVRTQEGRIGVVRLFTFGPVIQCHLRPLPPNPPLHNGDVVPTQVRVLNANGQPATFNTVVSAQVGYPQKAVRPWMEWRDKAGLVSLETLPAGSHWILAAPEFEQRSLFHLTNPTPEKLIEWRLRRSEPWTKHDLEFTPRFEPDERTGGVIVVTIKNKFDKPLTVSEADLHLEAGITNMVRGMSPRWADGKFQTIEIPAGQSGEMRVKWNDWVRRGFWASRDGEALDEPVLPPNEPGRIYVRVCLGNHGALPIAVTDPAVMLAEPLEMDVVPKNMQPDAPKDERTSLLESLIKDPKLETFQKLLALAEGKHPTPVELSPWRNPETETKTPVQIVDVDDKKFVAISAKVHALAETPDGIVPVEATSHPECAFLFTDEGKFLDFFGGRVTDLPQSRRSYDSVDIVNLGTKEDWFLRVCRGADRGGLTAQWDYYRFRPQPQPSIRVWSESYRSMSWSWSNGLKTDQRWGTLTPMHSKVERKNFVGVPIAETVTTAANIPTISRIVWDAERNRFHAAPKAFVKGLPLYEVDTQWSQELELLEPQAGQLTIAGGARNFDHWYGWEAAVPLEHHAAVVLTLPQREGPAKVIERKLAPGRHNIQLQAKPIENAEGVKLKLWIDEDHKEDFDLPFAFGEPLTNSPPIVHRLDLVGWNGDGQRFRTSGMSMFLVQRLLKETTDSFHFDIKLQKQPNAEAKATKHDRGTLTGRFIYNGEPPVPRDRAGDLAKLTADSPIPRDPNGRVSGVAALYHSYLKQGIRPETKDSSLLVDKDGGIGNIVIWVTSKDIPWTPKDNELGSATIFVKDGNFSPRIRLMTSEQPLEVTNQDPVPFNFHAHWIRNPASNILIAPLTKDNTIRLVVKEEEKLPVKYQSDIAPWADGYIVVRDNPYVAVSQPDGTFTMPDLPPGEWEFRVWHERNGYVAHWPKGLFTKKIEPGDNPLGNIRLQPELFAERTR